MVFYSDACYSGALWIAVSALFLPGFSCLMKIAVSLPPLKDKMLGPNNMCLLQSGHSTHVGYLLPSLWNNNKLVL